MASSRLFNLYARLPVWTQNVACTAAGVKMRWERYGPDFWRARAFLDRSQWWSAGELRAYQDERIRLIAAHVYDEVPYYRRVFDERRLRPSDIRSVDDLQKLPILDKETVRANFADLVAVGWPKRRRVEGKTGGTTGTALRLVYDRETVAWQWAVWWRHRSRFGLEPHDSFIVVAGRDVVPLSSLDPPFWRRNLAMRQTYVSIAHLTRDNLPALANYLQSRSVTYFSGYPSGLYLIAAYLLEHDLALRHPPRVTVTGAETLLPHQREVIGRAFHCEVADQYGASEYCCNASECEGHRYHVDGEFGVMELFPVPGLASNMRRIVGTSLHNPVMPLLRYETGDLAATGPSPCPCGRLSSVLERIDGRIESYIITPDGRQIGRLDFLFKESHAIKEAQLIQDRADHLRILVVRRDGYSVADETRLFAAARLYLGDVIAITVEYVAEIPRAPNGKFRQIVSQVYRDRFASTPDVGAPPGGAKPEGASV